MASGSTGERIAAYRRRRGLSQAALAGLVGRSESWLSQVERGIRSVDRLSVLLDLARVLHVDVDALLGRPWDLAPNGGPDADQLAALRSFFARYDHLTGALRTAPEVGDLRRSVSAAHREYQAANYVQVVEDLPGLLSSADNARRTSDGDRRQQLLAYITAYVVGAKLLTKLGAADLAIVAADRAASAAGETDSLAAQGLAAYQVVCALLQSDQVDQADRLAVVMAQRLQSAARPDDPVTISVAGSLWLIGAIIAARRTEPFEALDRLRQAEDLADLLGEDGNHFWTAFGPTNVAIHRVSVAAELGDPGEALRAAARVNLTELPEGMRSRRAQMHLDLAWAQAQRKRDAEATLHLLEAEQTAPEVVRYNRTVRDLMREMLARGGRRSPNGALDRLAVRAGVLA